MAEAKRKPKKRQRATFDESALPSLEELVEAQRLLDEAAPLLIDPLIVAARLRGHLIVGGMSSTIPPEDLARQLKTWQDTLYEDLPPELEDRSPEQGAEFLRVTKEAVPRGVREDFKENADWLSASVKRTGLATTRSPSTRSGAT